MSTVAIIAEYNPFHNGHLYHLNESKRITGAENAIAVMSGNFVQRGESAVLPKLKRAEYAVRSGLDIVFELNTHLAIVIDRSESVINLT